MVIVFPAKGTGAVVGDGVGFDVALGEVVGAVVGFEVAVGPAVDVGGALGLQAKSDTRTRPTKLDGIHSLPLFMSAPPRFAYSVINRPIDHSNAVQNDKIRP